MSTPNARAHFRQTHLLEQLHDALSFCQNTLNAIDGDISMSALSRLYFQIPNNLMDILSSPTANNQALREEFGRNSAYLFGRHYSNWGGSSIPDKKIMVKFLLKLQMRCECEQFDRILRKQGIICEASLQENHPAPPPEKYKTVACENASDTALTAELQSIVQKCQNMHYNLWHHMQKHPATPATSVLHRWEFETQALRHTLRYAQQLCPEKLGDLQYICDDRQFKEDGRFAMELCQFSDGTVNTMLFERMALCHQAITTILQTALEEMDVEKQASRVYQIKRAQKQILDYKRGGMFVWNVF